MSGSRLRPTLPWMRMSPIPQGGVEGIGAGNATDNALVRWDGTGGSTIQNSSVLLTDSPNAVLSPVTNDDVALGDGTHSFSDLFLASGGVINFNNGNATLTHSAGLLTSNVDIVVPTEVYGIGWNGSNEVPTKDAVYDKIEAVIAGAGATRALDNLLAVAINTDLLLGTSDGGALGSATKMWSDLFLASGGVINFNNGNATITHSAGLLTINVAVSLGVSNAFTTGTIELGHASDTTIARSSAGVITVEGNTIWHAGNDGSGSGLDADLLDGKNTGTAGNVVPLLDGANTWSALQIISLAGVGLRVVNTTDGNSVQVGKFEGDRATVANNDEAFNSYLLSDDGGTQIEAARITWAIPVKTAGAVDGRMDFSVRTGGTLAKEMQLSGTDLSPSSSDGLALGTTALMWSDLFLASGGVINFNNGDVTITHSANTMTFAGASSGYLYDAMNAPSSNDAAALGSATLMWSDLFLASGAVVNFNNGDVTITHTANVLTLGGGALALAEQTPILATGTERFQIEDASGSKSDITLRVASQGFASFNFATSAGTLASPLVSVNGDIVGQINFLAHDGTNYETAAYIRGIVSPGVGNNDVPGWLIFATTPDGSNSPSQRLILDNTGTLYPATNDGVALGTTTNKFSDLFLASGGVINFNNGDVTITHGANVITVGGGDLALGANNLTITGSIAATGARVTKGWFTDLEVTNMPTVNGAAITAAQADQETATSTITFVSPGRQQFHPSAAKFWAETGVAGNALASYNVTSIGDTGTGIMTVTIATDFSSANWCPVVGGVSNARTVSAATVQWVSAAMAAGTVEITNGDLSATSVVEDPAVGYAVAGFGDQ